MNSFAYVRWKNGFFRLWILFALVWLVGASALTRPWLSWGSYKESELKLAEFSAAYEKVEAAIAAGGRTNQDGKFVDVERLTKIRDGLDSHRLEVEANVRISGDRFSSELSTLFLPPLVLLTLGVAIGWVLRGFRRNQSKPDMER